MTKDITILYQGGSGGFALFYYLLLSGKYQTGLPDVDVNTLIQQQFPNVLKHNQSSWKSYEHWPNNLDCKQSSTGPRLFLICNPLFNPSVYNQNMFVANDTFKILLYTDIHLQLRMSWDKQAYWFTNESRRVFNAPLSTRAYLRWILDSSDEHLRLDAVKQTFKPDITVRLEDFINTLHLPNFPEPTTAQQEFLTYWISLQSKRAQQLLKRKGP